MARHSIKVMAILASAFLLTFITATISTSKAATAPVAKAITNTKTVMIPFMPDSTPIVLKRYSKFHIVKPGDTLSSIASARCGKSVDWSGIYLANKSIIGSDPDVIVAGQKLSLRCTNPPVILPASVVRHADVSHTVRQATPVSQGGNLSGTLSYTGLEALWRSAGGASWAAATAACIAEHESGGNQYALSPTDDYGYWQINISNGALATFDAYGNARAAIQLSYDGTNWSAWTTHSMCGV